MAVRPSSVAGWAMGLAALVVVAGSALGLATRQVALNLGPGDSLFVRGFEKDSDVDDKTGWHWTTYDAAIELPFATPGSDLDVALRYARMFGEEAVAKVTVGGVETEAFRARGGEVRTTSLRASGVNGPMTIAINVDSHERRNMGLRMDRVTIDVASGEPLRLSRAAALRPVAAVVILFASLLLLGASPPAAGGLALGVAVMFAARASGDLFGAWREVRLAPAMLVASTAVLCATKRWLILKRDVPGASATLLACAALVTMLFRLSLVSHPDFYYPDLLTHTRVVEAIREEGPAFFAHPADALNSQGAWTKPVMGSVSSLPYAVMFHTPFALLAAGLDLSIDQTETALKAVSCLISVLPILLTGALAVRFALPPEAALLLCVIPTYASRLSFALMPALLGHVFDLVVLLTLATLLSVDGMKSARSLAGLTGALLAGHLAYTSSVVNEGLFMAVLVALCLMTPVAADRVLGLRLFIAEGVALALALALYYRHFVGDVFGLVARITGMGGRGAGPGSAPTSVYPVESFWAVLFERTGTFFGWSWIALALVGLAASGPALLRSKAVRTWVLTYLGLILLRARIPDVFRYGHETLFLTPLVALLVGVALVTGLRKGGGLRVTALIAAVVLAVISFREQWQAVADQLGNAR